MVFLYPIKRFLRELHHLNDINAGGVPYLNSAGGLDQDPSNNSSGLQIKFHNSLTGDLKTQFKTGTGSNLRSALDIHHQSTLFHVDFRANSFYIHSDATLSVTDSVKLNCVVQLNTNCFNSGASFSNVTINCPLTVNSSVYANCNAGNNAGMKVNTNVTINSGGYHADGTTTASGMGLRGNAVISGTVFNSNTLTVKGNLYNSSGGGARFNNILSVQNNIHCGKKMSNSSHITTSSDAYVTNSLHIDDNIIHIASAANGVAYFKHTLSQTKTIQQNSIGRVDIDGSRVSLRDSVNVYTNSVSFQNLYVDNTLTSDAEATVNSVVVNTSAEFNDLVKLLNTLSVRVVPTLIHLLQWVIQMEMIITGILCL